MPETLSVQPYDVHNRFLVSNVHPPDWANPEPAGRYNLVVVGAGTAGLISAAGVVRELRGPDHRLRGHAADVEAVAAHEMALHERDLGAEARGHQRRDQARGAGADHDEVVAAVGGRVLPVRRMHVRDERGVVGVAGQHFDGMGHEVLLHWPVASRSARRAMRVTNRVTSAVAARPTPNSAHSAGLRPAAAPPAAATASPAALPRYT